METQFLLLGPLAVRTGGRPAPVPAAKHRAVLAALLLSANRVVTVDELAEVLWGQDLPSAPRTGVQNYVMRLRKSLGPAGSRITTQPGGYRMTVAAGELDVGRFEDLLRQARTAAREARWPEAAGLAAGALALWRGEPLADVGSDLLTARERPRLAELRLQALETRIDADLQLGRHGEVIGELRQLAAQHPLRENLHGLLMLALYRDGRQAEALAAYQHTRQVLVDELGAEPGPGLQQLHQQILTANPALTVTSQAAPAAGAAGAVRPTPRQLPAAVADFTGRTAELQLLTRMLDQAGAGGPGPVVISAIGGTAGVGKTALAVHWAHQVAERFPDGQLHVNLRGYDPSGTPVSPEAAIRGFLDALGVPHWRIPPDPAARAGLYRSLLSDKRLLIVLDNARDEQQVRPLLPGHPGCAVVVTSRNSLVGLVARDGAKRLELDLLPPSDAVALLRELTGARVDGEPDAAVALAGQCARLPLALRVAAELAARRPGVPLTSLVTELSDQQQRLDLLQAGGDPATSVRAVFSWSYQQLSADTARMFRLLGLQPGPDISVPAAASLAGTNETEARRLLTELARAHLITEHVPGRYAFHDLLRGYAADRAGADDSQDDRDAAIGRVLDHQLHTAVRAALLLDRPNKPVVLAPLRPGAAAGQPADHAQAMSWFEQEHQALLAAVTLASHSGFDSHAWQLPWAMTPFLRIRGHWQDWVAIQRTALAAATRLGDTAGQCLSGHNLALACTHLGDHDQARRHYTSSLTLYRQLGNRFGEAQIQECLCILAERQGRYADALGHAKQALHVYRTIGNTAGQARALNGVGWCHAQLGDYQRARTFCQRSLTLCAETGERLLEGNVWDSLGYAEQHLGNLAEAAACYQRALSLKQEAGQRFEMAATLTHLGDTQHDAGELAQARDAWQQALAILDDLQDPGADQVRAKLASTAGQPSPSPAALDASLADDFGIRRQATRIGSGCTASPLAQPATSNRSRPAI